jgi:ornithine cyclodeaminase/alanine dehydrogenase-like protein (mu-crystallin family)
MLIIDNELVSELLTMKDCIRVQEEAFRKLPIGAAIHRPRIDMYFPCDRQDGYFRWGTMEGANDGYFAIRMKSDIITWPKDANGNWTEEKYCREPGTYCGLIFLLSTRNGEPLAFINDGLLQHMSGRRRRGHRREISFARGFAYRRHAWLGRHGAYIPGSIPVRSRHTTLQDL